MKKIFPIFIILFVFFTISDVFASDATLYLEPASGNYPVNGNFSIKIKLNSDGTAINASQANISFPADLLSVQSVSKLGSIFQLWPEEPVFSNSQGTISFGGGVPAPGFTGIGTIAIVNFKAKKTGTANITVSDGQVLAADGRGTNILSYLKGGTYSFYLAPTEEKTEEKVPPKTEIPEKEGKEIVPPPEILVYPKTYTAGEEIFYVEGKALASSTVILFLKLGENLFKTWETPSDQNGNWNFSTMEPFKSGDYFLSAKTKDSSGNMSSFSTAYKVKVIFSGFFVGPLAILYSNLAIILVILIILIILILLFILFHKNKKRENRLRKEIKEAKDSLEKTFVEMGKEITRKIEYFDSKPGLNPEEKRIRDEMFYLLKSSGEAISKEIQDIEDELK